MTLEARRQPLAAPALVAVAVLFLGAWLMLSQWPTQAPPVESVTFSSADEMEEADSALAPGNAYLAALGLTLVVSATVAQVGIALRAAGISLRAPEK